MRGDEYVELGKSTTGAPGELIRVLIVEDDPGDELLTNEFLSDSDYPFEVEVARRLSEAMVRVRGSVECVLLDLGLPDAQGLVGLQEILRVAPHVAVIVLTGRGDLDLALEAVAAGAQDYLNKDAIDGELLTRSIRYSVERKRSEEASRQLLANQLVAAESARLERGLLPRPLLSSPTVRAASRYRPGGGALLLGGDFYDAIELSDGTLRVVIGDVAGHGPDEAAIGVALRIAWRGFVLAGLDTGSVLPNLQAILNSERNKANVFATVCDATISADRAHVRLRVAGHPAPMLINRGAGLLDVQRVGPPLGVVEGMVWDEEQFALAPGWSLLFYTDGIIEGHRRGDLSGRWGTEGVISAIEREAPPGAEPSALVDLLLAAAELENGGPLADDIALFLLVDAR